MISELNEIRNNLGATAEETQTYRNKIQRLLNENSSINDELRGAQENLRLSAGQVTKLNNELKLTCAENEELQRRIVELNKQVKGMGEYENKFQMFTEELHRLNGTIEKKNNEIRVLGGEMQEVQESLRLSTQQQNRMSSEISEYKRRLEHEAQEGTGYKDRLQRLLN